MIKRIGEIGDPRGMPVLTGWRFSLSPSKARPICRSERKECVHLMTTGWRWSPYIVSKSRALEIWWKAPLTSKKMMVSIFLLLLAWMMSWRRQRTAWIAARYFLPPICLLWRRSDVSARKESLVAIIFSEIFPRQLSRVMIL